MFTRLDMKRQAIFASCITFLAVLIPILFPPDKQSVLVLSYFEILYPALHLPLVVFISVMMGHVINDLNSGRLKMLLALPILKLRVLLKLVSKPYIISISTSALVMILYIVTSNMVNSTHPNNVAVMLLGIFQYIICIVVLDLLIVLLLPSRLGTGLMVTIPMGDYFFRTSVGITGSTSLGYYPLFYPLGVGSSNYLQAGSPELSVESLSKCVTFTSVPSTWENLYVFLWCILMFGVAAVIFIYKKY